MKAGRMFHFDPLTSRMNAETARSPCRSGERGIPYARICRILKTFEYNEIHCRRWPPSSEAALVRISAFAVVIGEEPTSAEPRKWSKMTNCVIAQHSPNGHYGMSDWVTPP